MTKKVNKAGVKSEADEIKTAENSTEVEANAETKTETKAEVKAKAKVSYSKRVAEVFASHPACKVIYMTTDETCFFQEQHARIHSESLKSNEIITIKREE